MTFEYQDTIMDDFDSIQVVTPPLVDPLTEAANAHMAALAEAEAAEIIVKQSSQEETEPETETTSISKDNPTKPEKKFASSTSASSSSASLSEAGQVVVPEIKNDAEEDNNEEDKENKLYPVFGNLSKEICMSQTKKDAKD